MNDKKFSITITTGTIIKTLAVFGVVFSLYLTRDIMMSVLFSLVIASGVDPAATGLQKRKNTQSLGSYFCLLDRFFFSWGNVLSYHPEYL